LRRLRCKDLCNTARATTQGADETSLEYTANPNTLRVRNAAPFTTAIRGEGTDYGVQGKAAFYGIHGSTTSEETGTGVYGIGGRGVFGRSYKGDAVYGQTNTGNGVKGESSIDSSSAAGVYGFADGLNSNGVIGEANKGPIAYAVWGKSTSGYAGFFQGRVNVNGTLTKSSGGFRIDHPLDPENKYLLHSFVESPDMLNVYSGNVATDENGDAVVQLPDYFEELNRDFRYQLTVIGQFAQAIVADEIRENRFAIKTDRPDITVSWQVTGVRRDAFARMNPVPVEEDKPSDERGTYLHPEAYRRPETQGAGYARERMLKEAQLERPDQEPTVPGKESG